MNRIPPLGGTLRLTTVFLVLALAAIVLAVAAEDARDAAARAGAFKLARKAHVDVWVRKGSMKIENAQRERGEDRLPARVRTTVGLIGVVMAVVVSIADVGRVGADACAALELPRSALELGCIEKTCV